MTVYVNRGGPDGGGVRQMSMFVYTEGEGVKNRQKFCLQRLCAAPYQNDRYDVPMRDCPAMASIFANFSAAMYKIRIFP